MRMVFIVTFLSEKRNIKYYTWHWEKLLILVVGQPRTARDASARE
jgi:hypothetical protein